MTFTPPTKPHLELPQLLERLEERGMIIPDKERAIRKLSQIGYYRLSGFWYPCRRPRYDDDGKYSKDPQTNLPIRANQFQDGVSFNDITDLYLFDKKIRQLIIDAVERIEIYICAIIAHEIGKIDPLAYKKEEYINPKILLTKEKNGEVINYWFDWLKRQYELIARSKEDCIKWHRGRGLELPFWAVVESWDFGLMSKYFENLNGRCQQKIVKRLEFPSASTLINWLTEINTLRNRCAHHSRVWNREENPISLKGFEKDEYFITLNLSLDARKRIYGRIAIMWYLVKRIGPKSEWIKKIADVIDSKPRLGCCPYEAMGFPDETGFPREKFPFHQKGEPC